jgi:hypothetical protein
VPCLAPSRTSRRVETHRRRPVRPGATALRRTTGRSRASRSSCAKRGRHPALEPISPPPTWTVARSSSTRRRGDGCVIFGDGIEADFARLRRQPRPFHQTKQSRKTTALFPTRIATAPRRSASATKRAIACNVDTTCGHAGTPCSNDVPLPPSRAAALTLFKTTRRKRCPSIRAFCAPPGRKAHC